MRSSQFIVEYSRDKTVQQYKKNMVKRIDLMSGYHAAEQFHVFRDMDDDDEGEFVVMPGSDEMDELITQILEFAEQVDTSDSKKYVPWLIKEWSEGRLRLLEDMPRYVEYLQLYDRVKNSNRFVQHVIDTLKVAPDTVDIQKMKNMFNVPAALMQSIMSRYPDPDKEKLSKKGNSTVIVDDDTAKVIIPHDEEAACYYGQGTQWCTAATRSHNMFDRYNRQGPLFIILPKKPEYGGEKYQIHFESDQFMDEEDNEVPLRIVERFPGFMEWIKKNKGVSVGKWLIFLPDSETQALTKIIGYKLVDLMYDTIMEWETEDEGWREMQYEYAKEHGLIDAEGMIDYDEADKDKNFPNDYIKYLKYNSREDFDSVSTLEDIKDSYPVTTTKYLITELHENSEDDPDYANDVQDIPKYFKNIARRYIGRRRPGRDDNSLAKLVWDACEKFSIISNEVSYSYSYHYRGKKIGESEKFMVYYTG